MPLTRGQRLKRLREQKGVEQQVAAPGIGISRPYLSLLEHDEKGRNISHLRATFEKAAAYYGVISGYLLAETPQEYIQAFVRGIDQDGLTTPGSRIAAVLKELELRWGDEFALPNVAEAMGTSVGTVQDLLADRLRVTESMAQQLSDLTGAPVDWLVPRPLAGKRLAPEIERIVQMAVENGLQPAELEHLIQAWLAVRNTKTPSGT